MAIRTATLRRALGGTMLAVLVLSLGAWLLSRDRLPPRIRIAAAAAGGLYQRFATLLAEPLGMRLGRPVEVLVTAGSEDNLQRLRRGEAELALLQGELAAATGVRVVAPLFRDVVHVVVRADSDLAELRDLAGHSVALGVPGSGMRRTAEDVLRHYGVNPERLEGRDRYFLDLARDTGLDAAVVTTGLLNPDLGQLLGSGRFRLLPVQDAEALAIRNPFLVPARIPRGFFREGPPVPAETLVSVSTTTVLAGREDAAAELVQAALASLYEGELRRRVPTLIGRGEATAWAELPLHPAAASWFQPFSGLGILADLMESLAALKELIFAFGAGLYLAFVRWRRLAERERDTARRAEKERLDHFFEETMRIERLQMACEDAVELRGHLDAVTRIKLRALGELTHEDLRGDVTFAIFLQQCANLTRKIQSKLELLARGFSYPASPAAGQAEQDG